MWFSFPSIHHQGAHTRFLSGIAIAATFVAVLLHPSLAIAQNPPTPPDYDYSPGSSRGYLIDDIEDLMWLAHLVLYRQPNDPDWNRRILDNLRVTQIADIDASATRYWDASDDDGDTHPFNDPNDLTAAGDNDGFVPIGASGKPFSGIYDGGGHTISNLYIRGDFDHRYTPDVGYFGLAENALIKDLRIVNADVSGETSTGILVGTASDGTVIRNVHTEGKVTAGTSSEYSGFGGIVGELAGGSILESSHSAATVEGTRGVGGLTGRNNSSTVRDSYFTGSASATVGYLGGVAGQSTGDLQRTYSIGRLAAGSDTVTFIGPIAGDIYAVGRTVAGNFWNADTAGSLDQGGRSGLSGIATRQMIDYATFRDAGWDFVSESANGTADVWDMDQGDSLNAGFPILAWQQGADLVVQHFDGGRGTPDNPYRIASLDDLSELARESRFWGARFVQTADIDASAAATWDDSDDDSDGHPFNDPADATLDGGNHGFRPVGTMATPFTGVYAGGGHVIRNLPIQRSGQAVVGLFGHLQGAFVDSLGLDRVAVFGGDSTGALAGSASQTTVRRSFSRGDVTGATAVGGLVGASTDLTLADVYTVTRITAVSDAGSLAGRADNPAVSNAYAGGAVSPLGPGGGLAHPLARPLAQPLPGAPASILPGTPPAAAPIPGLGSLIGNPTGGTFTASYWNADLDPTPSSPQGDALPALQLADPATFTTASPWDFAGRPYQDAADLDLWDMDQFATLNGGLPILSWQQGADTDLFAFAGAGTPDDPFRISTLTDLGHLSRLPAYWNDHFLQTADLDASATATWDDLDEDGDGIPFNDPADAVPADTSPGDNSPEDTGFLPIGRAAPHFTGTYDGGGHLLTGLAIRRPAADSVGLFSVIKGGAVKDLGLTAADVQGGSRSGLLAGVLDTASVAQGVFTAGTLQGADDVGPIAGLIRSAGLANAYTHADVAGRDRVGGLAGSASGAILGYLYSRSSLVGTGSVGGALGASDASILTSVYWDAQADSLPGTSPGDSQSGAEARATSDMTYFALYTDAGFDFAGETANGSDDIWDADQLASANDGYPLLAWQTQADGILTLFSAGQGTPERPYEIATLQDLAFLAQNPAYWDAHFRQTADIDASATATWDDADTDSDGNRYNDPDDADATGGNQGFPGIGQEPGYGVVGIGGGPFTGSYDGGGHTLTGLTIDRGPGVAFGLFGKAVDARIHDLDIQSASVAGASSTGILVGDGEGLRLANLTLSGTLSGEHTVGALAGGCTGCEVDSVRVTAAITISGGFTRGWAGGLIGWAKALPGQDTPVRNSSASGTLTVSGSSNPVGGLLGVSDVSVYNSYADVDIQASGAFKAGGLIGDVAPDTLIAFIDSYAAGDVHGGAYTGGLFGEHSDDALHLKLYASGAVSGEDRTDGISGMNRFAFTGTAQGVFWNTETTGQAEAHFGTGLTTSQMRQVSTFREAGWDFDGTESTPAAWDMDQARTVNNGFPILRWQEGADDVAFYYSGGQGTLDDPYRIGSLDDLRAFSETQEHWNRHFAQIADINAAPTASWNDSAGFASVGIFNFPPFSGSYNGRHHVIDSLHVTPSRGPDNSVQFHGLFGYAKGAVIDSVALRNLVLDGRNYAGGVVGYADNVTVRNTLVTGWITGSYAGGIMGYAKSSTIENVLSEATVEDQVPSAIGGLVGQSDRSTIRYAYAAGPVLSRDPMGAVVGVDAGGLVGAGSGTAVGAFWDLDRTGLSVSALGEGKTPLELTTRATFTDAGWDLQGESDNGTDDPWHIHPDLNNRYPLLAWRDSLSTPQVTLLDPDSVTNFSATVAGSVTDQGGIDVEAFGVIWSRSPNPTLANNDGRLDGPAGSVNFRLTPTRLNPSTTYYIRGFASNIAHTGYSAAKSFQTPTFTEGSGTPSDPYRIRHLHDLAILAQTPDLWSSSFEQQQDIDASPTRFWDDSDDDGDGFRYNDPADSTAAGANNGFHPIGTQNRPFDGAYVGRGRPMSISGLTIQRTPANHTGFIGYASGAELANLRLDSAAITGYNRAGILAGSATDSTRIRDVWTSGQVTGLYNVGGIVGLLQSSRLERVRNTAAVGRSDRTSEGVGGIAGEVSASSIRHAANHGTVYGGSVTGGIAGRLLDDSRLSSSYNAGYVDGANVLTAGISATMAASTLDSTFNAGDVRQGADLNSGGGLVHSVSSGTVTHSYYARQAASARGQNVPADSLESLAFWLNRGWDLQGESENGSLDTWKKPNDSPTPLLSFEDDRLTLIVHGTSGFRMLSTPFASPDLSVLLEPLWTQGMAGADLPSGEPNVWTYDGSTFQPVQDLAAHALAPGQGLGVYVYEDTDNDGDADLPIVLDLGGDPNPDRVTLATPYKSDATGDGQSGWSLVGNPFRQALDISRLSLGDYQFLMRDGINDYYGSAVYLWDSNASTWRVSDGFTGDIPDHRIAPFQSFFVKAATPDATTFTFESWNMTTPEPGRFLKPASSDPKSATGEASDTPQPPLTLALRVRTVSKADPADTTPSTPPSGPNAAPGDAAWITLTDASSMGADPGDALKLVPLIAEPDLRTPLVFTSSPAVFQTSETAKPAETATREPSDTLESAPDRAWAIQRLPHPEQWDGIEELRIPLHLHLHQHLPGSAESAEAGANIPSSTASDLELTWSGSLLDEPAMRVHLVDRAAGTTYDLMRETSLRLETAGLPEPPESTGLTYAAPTDPSRFELIVARSTTSTAPEAHDLPDRITLSQNVPNPFNPSTTLRFGLPQASPVTLEVYDAVGRRVAVLLSGRTLAGGWHSVPFDGTSLASGTYFMRLDAGGRQLIRGMVLLK